MAMQLKADVMRTAGLARVGVAVPRVEKLRAGAIASLGSNQRTILSAPLVSRGRTASERAPVATKSTSASFDEGITGKDDYSPLIAVAGFVAVWFNKLQVDRVKLLQALAILSLVKTVANIILSKGVGDGISDVVAPTVLAAAVLNIPHVTYLDAAVFAFGYYISEHLGGLFGVPFYVFLATAAVAIYAGYGTLWYVAAFGLAAAGRIYKSSSNKDPVPVIPIPAIAAAIWAIWKEAHFPLALSIFLAQTVWSGFTALNDLTKSAQN